MGINPLADYLTSREKEKEETEITSVSAEPAYALKRKERITIHLTADLIDRVKDVVYWEPGLTLTGFAEEAFEKVLQEREAKRGQPYPQRKERILRSGRPVS